MTEPVQIEIACPNCFSPLPVTLLTTPFTSKCPHCKTIMTGCLFPRLFKTSEESIHLTEIPVEKDSTCFFHSNKLAVSPCSACGRFLCSLCEMRIEGTIVCPICLEKLDSEKKVKTLIHKTTFWDSIALTLSLLPFLIWPVTLFTAPLTLIIIWRHFKNPLHYVIPRKRWRYYLAALIASAQIIGWMTFFIRFIR